MRAASAEVSNLVSAIRQGVGAKSVKDALLAAEDRLQLESYKPAEILPDVRTIWLNAVES